MCRSAWGQPPPSLWASEAVIQAHACRLVGPGDTQSTQAGSGPRLEGPSPPLKARLEGSPSTNSMVITRWLVRPRSTAGTCRCSARAAARALRTAHAHSGATTAGKTAWHGPRRLATLVHSVSRGGQPTWAPGRCDSLAGVAAGCHSPPPGPARGCACCPGWRRSVPSSGPRAGSPALHGDKP